MALFNQAVNFLTEICDSTVVLCTATQPLTEAIGENKMMTTRLMTQPLCAYEPQFRRVNYEDCTDCGTKRFDIEEAAEFIAKKAVLQEQVLAIFNTKSAAKQVYDALRGKVEGAIYHLSTSMCAEHRNAVLEKIKTALKNQERVICISTQVVEAGWDVSFRCVIRSLAGLDNLIQAAGRCNRNGGDEMGSVSLIYMKDMAENLNHLPDIRQAQQAMKEVLRHFTKKPEQLGGRLDSEKMIEAYYVQYLLGQKEKFRYPVKPQGLNTDLVDLLSVSNAITQGNKYPCYLKQAFRTAGQEFALIEEKPGTDVVVPFGKVQDLLEAIDKTEAGKELKRLMRKLQRYIVNISEHTLRKMGRNAVFQREDGILVLDKRFYDEDVGVQNESKEMEPLIM